MTQEIWAILFDLPSRVPRVLGHEPAGAIAPPVERLLVYFDQDMQEESFSLAEDIISFTGPTGAVVPTGFTWINQRILEITFAPLTERGTYRMTLSPQIFALCGGALDNDGDAVGGEEPDDIYNVEFTISNFALQFDGFNDWALIPHIPAYNFGEGDFSIELWVKTEPDYNGASMLFGEKEWWKYKCSIYGLPILVVKNSRFRKCLGFQHLYA
jgi:hypothetical protein